jgi:hypothetical protein
MLEKAVVLQKLAPPPLAATPMSAQLDALKHRPSSHAPLVPQAVPSLTVVQVPPLHVWQVPQVETQVLPAPQVWHWLASQLPQFKVPPHPSGAVPQSCPAGQLVAGVQQAPVVAWQTAPAAQQPPAQQTRPVPQAVPFATGVPAQAPEVQASPLVQGLPSSQAVPSGAVGLEQAPVVGAQVPATWHWSLATQRTAWVAPQAPAAQVAARHLLVGRGQSARVRHRQVWRPVASAAQRRAQQSAFSRHSPPGVRQAMASARSRPARPTAAAARPAKRRRRLPGMATARAMASKRSVSTGIPRSEGATESSPTR